MSNNRKEPVADVDQVGRPLLDSKEAARLLGISPRKLWSLTASGRIPRVKVDRSVRYRPEALAEFIAANESAAA